MVTHYWPPHVGGIETVAVEHARRLSERGWKVRIATSRLRGDRSHERMGAVDVIRFPCTNFAERMFSVPVPLMSPTMLTGLVREAGDTDVVVAHGHVYLGTQFAAVAANRTGRPFVLVQHAPFIDYGPVLNVVERAADHTLGRRVIRAASAVVAVSGFTADFVRSLVPGTDVRIVRSGVDERRFHTGGTPHARERPLVLTVRRLVPRNGVDRLVEAWRRAGIGGRAELLVGGSGPEMEEIRRLAAGDPSIRMMGYVPDEDLADLYREADVFVLPSRSGEGFGLVALEAMASGLPVVATASGGVVDIVTDGVNGLLVPPNDVTALADALTRVVDDAPLRARLAREAVASARASSWDASIDALEDTLVEVLSETRPP
jgi:D-inositol-3-phosphate glycosyltransferase